MAHIKDGWFHCGFCIGTTQENVIEINACERVAEGLLSKEYIDNARMKLKPEAWDVVNEDIKKLEKKYLEVLNRHKGIIFREEGHNGNGELVGSCWFNLREHPEALDFIMSHANDLHQEPGIEPHEIDFEGCENVYEQVYEGTGDITQHAVDVLLSFIDIEHDEYDEYVTAKKTVEAVRDRQTPFKETKIGSAFIGRPGKKVLDWLEKKAELHSPDNGGHMIYTRAGSDCEYMDGAPLLVLQLSDMACEAGYEYLWIQ